MMPLHLAPFPGEPAPVGFSVVGGMRRERERLIATYLVSAPAGVLVVPPIADEPGRRDQLWRSTCVELFVAAPGEAGYLEVNLSPSGDWNVYRFDGYRAG